MRPVLEKVTPNSNHSFALKEDIREHIDIGWHIHPEYELTLIAESAGKRVVGDHVAHFEAGDLLLIGPGLPHYMRNDERYYAGDPAFRCRAIVAHFLDTFLGEGFFNAPELAAIRTVMQHSARGLYIYGETRNRVADLMEDLLIHTGFRRLRALLDALYVIATSNERKPLASLGYTASFPSGDTSRINQVFDYLFQNYTEDIALADVASLIHMSPPAFCKFFKKHTGKTFSHTLNEIRIGHACKLFIEQGLPVTEVCYRSGYNTPSYFNRWFKRITGVAPLQYRKKFYAPPDLDPAKRSL